MKIDPSLDILANPNVVKDRIKEPATEQSYQPSRNNKYPDMDDSKYPVMDEEPEPEQEQYPYNRYPVEEEPEPEPEIDYEAEAKKRMIEMDKMLSEIDSLKKRGYSKYVPKEYNHRSDYDEVRSIHARVTNIAKQDAGLNISRKLLIGGVGLIEWLNTTYDPLGAKLVGFSQSIDASITDFDSVLLRCWEKYGQNLSDNNPLIELLIVLILSAATYHFTQSYVENVTNTFSAPQVQQPSNGRKKPPAPTDFDDRKIPNPIKTNVRPENGGSRNGGTNPLMGMMSKMMFGQAPVAQSTNSWVPNMLDTPTASPVVDKKPLTESPRSPPPEFNIQLPPDIFGTEDSQDTEARANSPETGKMGLKDSFSGTELQTATFKIPSPPQKQKKKRNNKRN
jgi:hypothetical protein